MAEGGEEGPSLIDMIDELGDKIKESNREKAEQGDMKFTFRDVEIEIGTTKSNGENSAFNNSSFLSLLNKVADKLDEDALVKEKAKEKQEDIDVEVIRPSSSTDSKDSLEGLLTGLHRQIKSSDWLKHNTAEKWKTENPELAKEYMEAIEKSKEQS